jgi:hypothetical protein
VSWRLVRLAALVALAAFYLAGAMEHARRVNTFKARGDQTGYLSDAEDVYANWHGAAPPILIGERNRMPLYAGFQALFYRPTISDPEFFEIGKIRNIYLSLALLALLYLIFSAMLPPLVAFNLILVVAFGYFVFKAGYVQSELLFYFLFFVAFLLMFLLLTGDRDALDARRVWRATAAGTAAALGYLTKAATAPLVAIFAGACLVDAFDPRANRKTVALATIGLTLVMFLAVLSPYLATNKRAFGRYFYNVNTTFYMWYDDWPQASVGTIKHGDGLGWPDMPADQLPGATRYLREHTLSQMAGRVGHGLRDMAERSYTTYWYFKYLVMYTACAVAVLVKQRSAFGQRVRTQRAALTFLIAYAIVYTIGIAFYEPVSGTGTARFLLAHVLPYLFVLSWWLSRSPYAETEWRAGRLTITTSHFHLFVTATLILDVAFTVWPRLMTTYGGF